MFAGELELGKHATIHTGESAIEKIVFQCKECNFQFLSENDLKTHKNSSHIEVECEKCSKYFLAKEELEYHTKTHDKENTEFVLHWKC